MSHGRRPSLLKFDSQLIFLLSYLRGRPLYAPYRALLLFLGCSIERCKILGRRASFLQT